jgi:hypothetical protein
MNHVPGRVPVEACCINLGKVWWVRKAVAAEVDRRFTYEGMSAATAISRRKWRDGCCAIPAKLQRAVGVVEVLAAE